MEDSGFCILNIEMNPAYVDVNVHPAKLEVRFSNEGQIFKAIYETVKQGLTKEDLVRNAIRYENDGKGFKLEEKKSSFEYLKPTFHKLTLNDKKHEEKSEEQAENTKNYQEQEQNQEMLNEENSSANIKNDRPAKSKIDEIIEAYRQKYGIDKNDDRINKSSMDEKVDNIKIEETEDLFRKCYRRSGRTKSTFTKYSNNKNISNIK